MEETGLGMALFLFCLPPVVEMTWAGTDIPFPAISLSLLPGGEDRDWFGLGWDGVGLETGGAVLSVTGRHL